MVVFNYISCNNHCIYPPPMAQQPPSGPTRPHYRSFTVTLRHTTLGKTPLDEWSAGHKNHHMTAHNTHNRGISMPPSGIRTRIASKPTAADPRLSLRGHRDHSTNLRSAHAVFMCFVFIWEQTATCATYSINWLVFITEMKSVYSAVRTGSLNKAVCVSSLNG